MENERSVVDILFDKEREFTIIGLTGRTGSGCSSVAEFLSCDDFNSSGRKRKSFSPPIPIDPSKTNEERKYNICYKYLKENWTKANWVKITHLIVLICVQGGSNSFLSGLKNWVNSTYDKKIKKINADLETIDSKIKYIETLLEGDNEFGTRRSENVKRLIKLQQKRAVQNEERREIEKKKIYNDSIIVKIESSIPSIVKGSPTKEKMFPEFDFENNELTDREGIYSKLINKSYEVNDSDCRIIHEHINDLLPKYYDLFKKAIGTTDISTVELFQLFGNYIRYKSFFESEETGTSITNLMDCIIQFYRYYNSKMGKPTLIVLDALRNPYEISYLRDKYPSFYAVSIWAEEKDRRSRLTDKNYPVSVINNFDETEYPTKKVSLNDMFTFQNIEKCTEMSDIHIVNNDYYMNEVGEPIKDNNKQSLKKQLVRYLSLMKHPGLVIPTHEERTMQIAFTAKYNSGCISRQVGAVITDKDFSLKTIGWNTVPEGQTPCLLRDCYTLLDKGTPEETLLESYSDFERGEDSDPQFSNSKTFKECLREKFPTTINESDFGGRNVSYCFKDTYNGNLIHAGALHAEENAFLQISKYGGQGVVGGKLFTTASPCELCSKKAYQLGIRDIYYIDLYPGISKLHILERGKKEKRPKMHAFKGAIGRAYISLYQPIISYKDEINDILNKKKQIPSDES